MGFTKCTLSSKFDFSQKKKSSSWRTFVVTNRVWSLHREILWWITIPMDLHLLRESIRKLSDCTIFEITKKYQFIHWKKELIGRLGSIWNVEIRMWRWFRMDTSQIQSQWQNDSRLYQYFFNLTCWCIHWCSPTYIHCKSNSSRSNLSNVILGTSKYEKYSLGSFIQSWFEIRFLRSVFCQCVKMLFFLISLVF